MKVCSRCKENKTEAEFKKNRTKPDGLQIICSDCSKELNKIWYNKNKKNRLLKINQYRNKTINWLKEYKSTLTCSKCPENHPSCLEFHHIDPNSKLGNISEEVRNWSIDRLKTELQKCIVLCANCHRKEHYMVYEA